MSDGIPGDGETEQNRENSRVGVDSLVYFDKQGKQINEFDVLKVFHFIGSRRKRHYMYKWVRRDDKGRMAIMHLTESDEPMVALAVVCNKDGVFEGAEIVQSRYC